MRRTVVRTSTSAVALAGLLLGPTAMAQQGDPQRTPPMRSDRAGDRAAAADRMLEDLVFVRLADRAWVGGNFGVDAQGHTVTLSGTVPSEATKQRILRVARRTPGVFAVRDQLRVDPAMGAGSTRSAAIDDSELVKQVAQKIASALPGAKAGADWWFSGWRVEGAEGAWNLVVEADRGAVTLDGDVPRAGILRQAIEAALDVPGVQSVRSELTVEPPWARYPRVGYPYGYPLGHVYNPYVSDYFVYYDAEPDGPAGQGAQSVTGDVASVDPRSGRLTLRTDEGTMDLRLPASALQGIEQGDRITLGLSLREAGAVTGDARTARAVAQGAGWLGIAIRPVDRDAARNLGLEEPHGAVVERVMDGSPAERAGIRPGDVVLAMDDSAIQGPAELTRRVGELAPGTRVELTLLRDRARRVVPVDLSRAPGRGPARSG